MTTNHSMFDDALRRKVAHHEMAPEGFVLENIFSHEAMQQRRRTRRRFFFILFFLLSSSSLTTMALMLNRDWFGFGEPELAVATAAKSVEPFYKSIALTPKPATMELAEVTASFPLSVSLASYVPLNVGPSESSSPLAEPQSDSRIQLINADKLVALKANLLWMPARRWATPPSPAPPVWEVTTSEGHGSEFHLGTHLIFSRTSILNDIYFNTYEGQYLTANTDFGVMFGATVGYDFRGRIGIESGVNFLSMQVQRYSDIVGVERITQEVLLSYMNFPLYLKLKQRLTKSGMPFVLNALIGGHYGKLKSAELSVNGAFPGADVTNMLAEGEIAYGGGLTADFYLDDYLYITLGVRGTLSQDISGHGLEGKEQMRNLLMGVNFGLSFALTK